MHLFLLLLHFRGPPTIALIDTDCHARHYYIITGSRTGVAVHISHFGNLVLDERWDISLQILPELCVDIVEWTLWLLTTYSPNWNSI